MTDEQKKLLRKVYDKLNRIEHFDNKNLCKRQDYELLDCLDILETLLKEFGENDIL